MIDEVQYAPGLFRHLKVVVDQERQRNGAIVLTGSQPFALMRNVSESLAGRAAVVNLHGLSLAEILGAAPQSTLPQILLRGSFPELWSQPAIEAGDFHRSYVSTYLERDLRSLQQVGNLQQFERFLRASALRSGQLLNRAELARDVGIAASTAGLWLSVLERSGLVFLLEPWFGNAGKRLSRSPKLYWRDTGLLCWLIGIGTEAELHRSPLVGAVWETFVVGRCADKWRMQPLLARCTSGATAAKKWIWCWSGAAASGWRMPSGASSPAPGMDSACGRWPPSFLRAPWPAPC
ncbi:MAG: ATP-binding protein [Cyanobium sp. M30B3]|nr:MAG: ATP-binding protein [Cyanobium sp. M30B3]